MLLWLGVPPFQRAIISAEGGSEPPPLDSSDALLVLLFRSWASGPRAAALAMSEKLAAELEIAAGLGGRVVLLGRVSSVRAHWGVDGVSSGSGPKP